MSKKSYRAKPSDGIAFVSGASSGIGRAVVIELAERGYSVAAMARRADDLRELAATRPAQIFAYPGDVRDTAGNRTLIAQIEKDQGPIALAFLNAGLSLHVEREGFDAALVAQTYAVNVQGTANCLDPLLAAMAQRHRGQIAINASLAGYNGLPSSAIYGSSKAALIYMAEALSQMYREAGVTLQVINHGFVRTAMTDQEKDFAQPYKIEPEAAAKIICDGFERGGFEIAFPWQLTALSKFIRALPYAAKFKLMDYAVNRAKKP
ncbi:SDR family NAD(P)-dependent oxidoreductase [uncultured Methylovirgula sp.]|uniref:SDR family NAD(P)-dependent oxidoreductase n=1 Tax=uncultured Methylovirgula sp. TaxID=1285960 RepID=UPI002609097D|nr:SDR family NAD(P)-dependent oxidoreductase [uncultured Methylovirgula sp.]